MGGIGQGLFGIDCHGCTGRHSEEETESRGLCAQALKLVQIGELSAGRLALDGAQVADGNQATLKALTDKRRRPPVPGAPLSQFVLESQPEVFSLDEGLFVQSLRSSRRGAAVDPSGMTADYLQPVLDTARDASLFLQFATVLARGQAPAAAVEGVRMGRITALKKPNGGIRGLWLETSQEGWSPGRWQNRWQRELKPRQPNFSMH